MGVYGRTADHSSPPPICILNNGYISSFSPNEPIQNSDDDGLNSSYLVYLHPDLSESLPIGWHVSVPDAHSSA